MTGEFLALRKDGAERPCVGHADLFFRSDGRESPASRRERESQAAALCGGCAVRAECLDEALGRGERWGIWGGLNFDERARFAQARSGHAA